MNRTLKKSLLAGLGVFVGTLIYTGLLSPAREFDIMRAFIVGAVVVIGAAAYYRQKQ